MGQIQILYRFILTLVAYSIVLMPFGFAAPAIKSLALRSKQGSTPLQAVVQIEAGSMLGSGFFINPSGMALTNQHVVGSSEMVNVRLYDGRLAKGFVVAADEKLDLALVKVELMNTPFLQFYEGSEIKEGNEISIAGSPLGLSHSLIRATVSAVSRKIGDKDLMQIDGNVNPGLSGGPVLNRAFDVVGITVAMIEHAQGIGLAIKLPDIYRFVQMHGIGLVSKDLNHQFIQSVHPKETLRTGVVNPKSIFVLGIASVLMLISALLFWYATKSHRSRVFLSQHFAKSAAKPSKKENFDDIKITLKEGSS